MHRLSRILVKKDRGEVIEARSKLRRRTGDIIQVSLAVTWLRRDSRSCMRRGRHVIVLPSALVIGLFLVGCSGSGKAAAGRSAVGGTASGKTGLSGQSHADARLISSADEICRRFNSRLISTARSESSNIAREAPRNAAIELQAVGALSKLSPPASLARDWAQILAYRRKLAQELVALARAAKAGDAAGIRALGASKKRVRQKLTQLAARDGFKDCTSVGTLSVSTLFPTLHPRH